MRAGRRPFSHGRSNSTKANFKIIFDSEFYKSKKWAALQAACKLRDGYYCRRCKKDFSKRRWELQAHHIVPRKKGGPDTLINLLTLCKSCHSLLHPHMKH